VSQIIQIAGVRSIDEARMLAAAGATHIGLPLRLAVHAPDVGEAGAAAIVRGLPASVTCVLITYLTDPAEAAALARTLGVGAVQLHGEMPPAPGLALFKSLIVAPGNQAELLSLAAAFEPHVDAFLTDTLDPLSGAGGATGKTHDWAVSRRIVEAVRRPVILAGGLTPDNVREAIAIVRPSGVDAHTGLEDARGDKDPALVRRFVAEARAGFAALGR
jgi:phosphoribosylanthranilate isomerase